MALQQEAFGSTGCSQILAAVSNRNQVYGHNQNCRAVHTSGPHDENTSLSWHVVSPQFSVYNKQPFLIVGDQLGRNVHHHFLMPYFQFQILFTRSTQALIVGMWIFTSKFQERTFYTHVCAGRLSWHMVKAPDAGSIPELPYCNMQMLPSSTIRETSGSRQ
jgi:hypothetical protein